MLSHREKNSARGRGSGRQAPAIRAGFSDTLGKVRRFELLRLSPAAAWFVLAVTAHTSFAAPTEEPAAQGAAVPRAAAEPTPAVAGSEVAPGEPAVAVGAADSWLHQPESQARLNRVVEELLQEGKSQTSPGQALPTAHAYAVAYAFTPLHGVLIRVGQALRKAGQQTAAEIIFLRLLAENPEPLLRSQASALLQQLRSDLPPRDLDTDAEVKTAIERGKDAFRLGRYQDALAAYSTAYAMQELPRLLFNMAQAFRRLGQSERAYLMYHRFLQADPQTTLRRETEGYIAELRLLTSLTGPQYAPRPKWRIATGAATLSLGVGLLSLGAGVLAINGQCVTTDGSGQCMPTVDASGRPLLPRTAQVYDTTTLGASLLTVGVALGVAGVVLTALPGRRLRPPAGLALGTAAGDSPATAP